MNARKIGLKVMGSLFALAALSTLSGCVVTARPVPTRTRVVVTRPAPVVRTTVVYR
jgi:hypothetical protein